MKLFTWKQRAIVWGTTLATLAVFLGIGYLLDLWLSTGRISFFIGLFLSFPVNSVLLKRNITKYGIEQ